MKITFLQKIIFPIFAILTFLTSSNAFAWSGFDFEQKTQVDISEGNLVREGLVIQFYDQKTDDLHSAKVLFMESSAFGVRIQIKDLTLQKERVLIMEN